MSAQNSLPKTPPRTVMGFDFGTKKIGLATGQSITETATPIEPIAANEGKPNWDNLSALVRQWEPEALVVGLPTHLDGSNTEITKRAQKFANRLHGRFQLPTYTTDERLTTVSAKQEWQELAEIHGWPRSYVNNHWIDSLAAAMIIHSWFRRFSEE